MSNTNTCGNCRYFDNHAGRFGTCRANPPTVLYQPDGFDISRFPNVQASFIACRFFVDVNATDPDTRRHNETMAAVGKLITAINLCGVQ